MVKVSISGTVAVGNTISAVVTPPEAGTYQWSVDGKNIPGESGATYDIIASDGGKKVGVKFTGATNSDTSDLHLVPKTSNEKARGAVSVGITATVRTFTATDNITDDDGMGVKSYQWCRDLAAIAGATSASYVETPADAGSHLQVVVTYTDGAGNKERVVSGVFNA